MSEYLQILTAYANRTLSPASLVVKLSGRWFVKDATVQDAMCPTAFKTKIAAMEYAEKHIAATIERIKGGN